MYAIKSNSMNDYWAFMTAIILGIEPVYEPLVHIIRYFLLLLNITYLICLRF